jgi:hypothetical protein
MTKDELKQLAGLNDEIEELEQTVEQLHTFAEGCTVSISGLPHAGKITDKTGIAAAIADCTTAIEELCKQTVEEYARLTIYVTTIRDSTMRRIMNMRYKDNLTWDQIAYKVGGGNTADSIRMMHNRFLRYGDGEQ